MQPSLAWSASSVFYPNTARSISGLIAKSERDFLPWAIFGIEFAPLRAEGCGQSAWMSHPCLSCGACCAYFRVGFHWSETDAFLGGTVPPEMTAKLDPHRVAMLGTAQKNPRCIALDAEIGRRAACSIYARRPSVCREVPPSWEFGEASPQCDRARLAHGLKPLTPEDWLGPERTDTPSLPRSA